MSHIFISYSRKDSKLVEKIVDALTEDDLKPWIDWKSIPKGEEVQREIYHAIEEADIFLFFVSPDSVRSKWCMDEIEHATQNNKRILPIFVHETSPETIHPEISKRNWIFCREGQDDFNKAIQETRKTIHTDYEWLKHHTELQVKALKWEQKKDNSRLLRGKELYETNKQLPEAGIQKDPEPTDLQRQFVLASIKHEKTIRQWLFTSIAAALVIFLGLAMWPYLHREHAILGKWVPVQGGSFIMGMDKEEAGFAYSLCSRDNSNPDNCFFTPDGLLTLSGRQNGATLLEYKIMDNEVTIAQYQQCVTAGACLLPDNWNKGTEGINEPVTGLNWLQSMAYCTWLGGRLPSEAEWEKAARGPYGNYFPWGSKWEINANIEAGKNGGIQSIDRYAGSDISYYEIKNMAGNVREWTASERPLQRSPEFENLFITPENYVEGLELIVRGGSWNNDRSVGMASNVGWIDASFGYDNIGFRCVCPEGQTCREPWSKWWKWFGKY